MKPPRIVQITDPFEKELLLAGQSKPHVPALYQNLKNGTHWCDEAELYRWRKMRAEP